MRTLYLDNEYKLHITDNDYREIETDLFDNYCDELIECMRYIPEGETYTKPDGTVLHGEFIQPFKKTYEAEKSQIAYEYRKQVNSLEQALGDVIEELYQKDLDIIYGGGE